MFDYIIDLEKVCVNYRLVRSTAHSFKDLFVQFGRTKIEHEVFNALKNVSFSVMKGERIGIVGRNGAGKSTLLKTISGIVSPTSGRLYTAGRITPLLELGTGFDFELTGQENIFLNGAILGLDGRFIKKKYDEIVDFSELGEFIDQPLRNYSSGMVARLAFSIAVITEPEVLIIDEILSVGDGAFQNKSKKKMVDLINNQTTVLMVSHDVNQIRQICEKAVWLENGEIKEVGDSARVCDLYCDSLKDSEQ